MARRIKKLIDKDKNPTTTNDKENTEWNFETLMLKGQTRSRTVTHSHAITKNCLVSVGLKGLYFSWGQSDVAHHFLGIWEFRGMEDHQMVSWKCYCSYGIVPIYHQLSQGFINIVWIDYLRLWKCTASLKSWISLSTDTNQQFLT